MGCGMAPSMVVSGMTFDNMGNQNLIIQDQPIDDLGKVIKIHHKNVEIIRCPGITIVNNIDSSVLSNLNISVSTVNTHVFKHLQAPNLIRLQLQECSLASFAGIEHLTWLQELDLSFNQLTALTNIHQMSGLFSLNVSNNLLATIQSISMITALPKLNALQIVDNPLTSIEDFEQKFFAILPGTLEQLDVGSTELISKLQDRESQHRIIENSKFIQNWAQAVRGEELTLLQDQNVKSLYGIGKIGPVKKVEIFFCENLHLEGSSELTKITEFRINDCKLRSLLGMRTAVLSNLIVLDLFRNQLVSLNGIQGLKTIQKLFLGENQLTSISELFGLKNMKELHVGNNKLTSLKGIDRMLQLEVLNASKNMITSLYAIQNIQTLKELKIDDNQIISSDEMHFILNLKQLEVLHIFNNPFCAEPDLMDRILYAAQSQLKVLYCTVVYKNDLVENEQRMAEVKAGANPFIQPIIQNIRVEKWVKKAKFGKLDIYQDEAVTDLRGIGRIDQLTELNAEKCPLMQMQGIDEARTLTSFTSRECGITTAIYLKKPWFIQMQKLIIDDNKLDSLDGIEDLRNLTELSVAGNQLTHLKQIQHLIKLKKLFVQDNLLKELPNMSKMQNLEFIDLSYNSLINLLPLAVLKKLSTAIIQQNKLTSISGLETIPLKVLDVSGNQLTSLTEFKSMKLEELNVVNNQIGPSDQLFNLQQLPLLSIKVLNNPMATEASFQSIFFLAASQSILQVDAFPDYAMMCTKRQQKRDLNQEMMTTFKQTFSNGTLEIVDQQRLTDLYGIAQVGNITKLSIISCKNVTMEGIEEIRNLEEIEIKYCNIDNIDFIEKAKLVNLKVVNVGFNQITSIRPIAGLNLLEVFRFETNQVADDEELICLQRLNNLKEISLFNNPIANSPTYDYKLLYVLPDTMKAIYTQNENLNEIELTRKRMEVIKQKPNPFKILATAKKESVSEKIARWETLIRNNKLELKWDEFKADLQGLNSLDVEQLVVSKIKEFTLDGIEECRNITEIIIRECGLKSISPFGVSTFDKIKKFDCQNCELTQVKELKNLVNLEEVNLSANQLRSLQGVEGLEHLNRLTANSNMLLFLFEFKSLDHLYHINLCDNQITSLAALKNVKNLTELLIANNRLNSLDGVEELRNLVKLDIAGNLLSSLTPIRSLRKITHLFIQKNRIELADELFNISQMQNLQVINLIENPMVDEPEFESKILCTVNENVKEVYYFFNEQNEAPTMKPKIEALRPSIAFIQSKMGEIIDEKEKQLKIMEDNKGRKDWSRRE
ncbi:Conserved_hypothetical protein [Hexamita inflata]|uniref:Uncharacterized protein n=1 Tax=Hexamita inflata TaxID=28002 RepID=A0AA86P3V0_9EUKA|nr:Conserved hypothetical protein [Hexamita inflata]CAI9969684.1 Conserved hypothetical protein [Hexamita inflata]